MKMEDYNEYYIQGSDHYLIPKDEFKELFNEMVNLKEESKKQKEVIDKAIKYINSSDISIDIRKTDESLDYVSTNELLDILNEALE